MTDFLSCIRIRAASGRPDGFISSLQCFLETISARAEKFSYAEILLRADGGERSIYWMEGEQPEPIDCAFIASAAEVDAVLNLCSDEDCASDAQSALLAPLADGSLAGCVRVCALTRDGENASVFLSGMREGKFFHSTIDFADGMEAIPADLCWNSLTHEAHFTFPESALDDAWDLSDLLQERIDEIDLEFSYDDGALDIRSVQLPDAGSVEAYRAALEGFLKISGSARISGALSPEAENAFALLRFAASDGRVAVQTAAAEI